VKRAALVLIAACAATSAAEAGRAWAYQGATVTGGGAVAGTVRFTGSIPAPVELPVTKDPSVCGEMKTSQELVISSTRGIKNAIVTIEGISAGKPLEIPEAPILANAKCLYEPHVQALPVGTRLQIVNDDPVLHNTHGVLGGSKSVFNIALTTRGRMIRKLLKEPGLIEVGCDAGHTWMKAYVLVSEHPYYAVTDTSGAYSIKDVPPGTYSMTIWHEMLGKQTREVTVRSDASSDESFSYEPVPAVPAPAEGSQSPGAGTPQ